MQKHIKILIAGAGLLLSAGGVAGVAISAQGDRNGQDPGQSVGLGQAENLGQAKGKAQDEVQSRGMKAHGLTMHNRGGHRMKMRGGFHQQHRSGGFRHRQHGSLTRADAQSRARERFARFDANSDGVIDASEIEARFVARRERRQAHRGGRRGAMRWHRKLARFDTDGNGKISRGEFESRMKRRFAQMDLTNDGAITDADLPPRLRDRNFLTSDAMVPPRMARGRGKFRRHQGGRKGGMKLRKFARLRMANTDDNNTVTSAEFFAAADNRFSRMDRNGDGVIDPTDRVARRSEHMAYRVARFIHRFGVAADASGKVTRDQFQTKADERFARHDSDNDGVLTGMERARGNRMGRWHRSRRNWGGGHAGRTRGHRMGRGHNRGSHGGNQRGSGQ